MIINRYFSNILRVGMVRILLALVFTF